jgi:hypothetical protein
VSSFIPFRKKYVWAMPEFGYTVYSVCVFCGCYPVHLFTGHLFLMSRASNKEKENKEVQAYMPGPATALYPK